MKIVTEIPWTVLRTFPGFPDRHYFECERCGELERLKNPRNFSNVALRIMRFDERHAHCAASDFYLPPISLPLL